jgi:hypothetical protein
MKSMKAIVFLVLLILLPDSAFAKETVIDPGPVNFRSIMPQYLYQEVNAFEVGPGGGMVQTGSYFFILAGIRTGEFLGEFEDIIDVKAEHLETGREYSCAPWHCTYLAEIAQQSWRVLLRPEQWMFEGTWEFTMSYWGENPDSPKESKKVVHIQRARHGMGPVTFPIKPSYVNITQSEDGMTLSWSAIGNPRSGPFDYEVWILNDNNCPEVRLRGNWTGCSSELCGLFDAVRNRVTFKISQEWQNHFLILRNIIHVQGQSSEARRIIRSP